MLELMYFWQFTAPISVATRLSHLFSLQGYWQELQQPTQYTYLKYTAFVLIIIRTVRITSVQRHTVISNDMLKALSTVLQWRQSKFILRGWNFFTHKEADEASAQRSQRPEGPRVGVGFWGGGSEPLPYQLGGLGERCKLPQWGPGLKIWNMV